MVNQILVVHILNHCTQYHDKNFVVFIQNLEIDSNFNEPHNCGVARLFKP